MKKTVFVSHRTWDRPGRAKQIFEALEQALDSPVFLDSERIGVGEDITAIIEKAFDDLGYLIVVLGPNWFKAAGAEDEVPSIWRDKDDWVRAEIRSALAKGVPVVPLYVDDRKFLTEKDLPDDIKGLVATRAADHDLPSTGAKRAMLRADSFERDLKHFVSEFAKTYQVPMRIGAEPPKDQAPAAALPPNWLERHLEITIDRYGTVGIRMPDGHTEPRPLDSVYYPLGLDTRRSSPEADPAKWWNVLEGEKTAVTGGAGAGKSTLLNYIAVQVARRRQRIESAAKQGAVTDPGESGRIPSMIPVVIDLAAAAPRLDRVELGGRQVLAEIQPEQWLPVLGAQIDLSPEQTRALLETGEVLLLIDKLDEVPDPRDRQLLLAGIVDLQRRYRPLGSANHVTVACRTSAWRANESASEFREFALEPMNVSTRDRYLENWCRAVWGPEAGQVLESLETGLSESEAIGDIAANPQMCQMIAMVARSGPPPRQRAILYERFIELGFKAQPLSVFGSRSAILEHLTALAVEMQQSNVEDGDTAVSLAETRVQTLLGKRLSDGNEGWRAVRERGKALLNALVDHTGLVVVEGATTDRQVRFDHKTFQEYLAASHFAERDVGVVIRQATNPAWSETLALTAGVLARESEDELRHFLELLMGSESAKVDDPADPAFAGWVRKVAAASVCLRELALYPLHDETLAPARQAYDRIVPNLDEIEPQARFAIVEELGSVHDPRLENESRWIAFPGGSFVRGSNSPEAWPQERPEAEVFVGRYRIQRWPVTVAEFRRFIRDGGYQEQTWWSREGWQWLQNGGGSGPLDWQHHRNKLNRPVTGVCFWEAQAYCRWLHEAGSPGVPAGWTVRLPTECEWERAARDGSEGGGQTPSRFPWGDEWEADRANCLGSLGRAELAPVGLFSRGKSPAGSWDMAGNVAEHCLDGFAPYQNGQLRDPLVTHYEHGHVVRGGAYDSPPLDLRVTYRFGEALDSQDGHIGFRCAAVPDDAISGVGDG